MPDSAKEMRATDSNNGQLHAGVARVDVTPEPGCGLAGNLIEVRAREVHDPLFARALLLHDDEVRVAIVAVDLLLVQATLREHVANRIEAQIALPRDNLLITASHTHSAPATDGRMGWPVDEAYVQTVADRIVEAVCMADDAVRPVELVVGREYEDSVAQNSRLWLKDGTIAWFAPLEGDVEAPTGPMDPEVGVASFVGSDGSRVATLFTYGLHANVGWAGQEPQVSADYPGVAATEISGALGGEAMYLQTCCANVHTTCYGQADFVGKRIAEKAIAAVERGEAIACHPLAVACKQLNLPIRDIPAAHLREIHDYCDRLLTGENRGVRRDYFAAHAQYVRELKRTEGSLRTFLQVIRIGELALVAVPGEMFVELSMSIKRDSPFPHTFCLGVSNDYIFYIPTAHAYNEEGGYQCFNSIVSPLAADMIVEAAAGLLEEVRKVERS